MEVDVETSLNKNLPCIYTYKSVIDCVCVCVCVCFIIEHKPLTKRLCDNVRGKGYCEASRSTLADIDETCFISLYYF